MESKPSAQPSGHPSTETAPDDRVQGTALNFGEFRALQYRHSGRTLLQFDGTAGTGFARELERLALQCRGTLGLDFARIVGLTPKVVPVLERIRKRFDAHRRGLFLCNPPSRLIDLLTLAGVVRHYNVAGADSAVDDLPAPAAEGKTSSESTASRPKAAAGGAGPETLAASREIARFEQSVRRTMQLERGLDSAARCVQQLLPSRSPEVPGYSFAFAYRQSEKIGGDFFDFFPLEGGRLGISIGDVSGRGIGAAILMVLAKKVIAIRARDARGSAPPGPREVLVRACDDLWSDMDRSSFITALYGVLDPAAGTFHFARAGHERPVLIEPGTGQKPNPLVSGGAALGVLPAPRFQEGLEERLVKLAPASRLLLYTDGLVDATSPRGQTFSRLRLVDGLRHVRADQSPQQIINGIFDEIARHTGGVLPEDDMTAIVIARE